MGVSIPVEFSSALQLSTPFGKRGHFHEFQSQSGFLACCDDWAELATTTYLNLFQSLSGFLARCDARG
jgi:hypothetical protein